MKEKFIAKVPSSMIAQPTGTARSAWTGRYNVSCWLRLQQQRPCKVVLLLKYVDHEGVTKSVTVDQCATELSATMLLSGQAEIPATGRIIDMGVYLEATDTCPPYTVDELYVQSTDKTAPKAAKLIAAA
jgi:hypothetical protein